MDPYAPYANAKPWVKFKKFVLAGVAFDDTESCCKMSSGATRSVSHREKCAHTITSQMEEFFWVTGEEKLAAATRAAELRANETSEYILGLRNSDPGGKPYLCDLSDDSNPVLGLGPRPSARSGNVFIFFTFVLMKYISSFVFSFFQWAGNNAYVLDYMGECNLEGRRMDQNEHSKEHSKEQERTL